MLRTLPSWAAETLALPVQVQLIWGLVVGRRHARAERIRRTLEAECAAEEAVAATASTAAHAVRAAGRALAQVVARLERAGPVTKMGSARHVLDAPRAEQALLGSSRLAELEDVVHLGAIPAHGLSTSTDKPRFDRHDKTMQRTHLVAARAGRVGAQLGLASADVARTAVHQGRQGELGKALR
jgi:prolyl-tRNA editing enzyme YbaK/EbsC (Cys-tRNA(Pro) deacylase)